MSILAIILSTALVLFIKVDPSLATESSVCDINELKAKLEEVEQSCDKRYKDLEEKVNAHVSRRSIAGGIAFSAKLSAHITHIPLGTTIKYEQVTLNDGQGYDKQTGVFTAPETGVYMFTYFIGHGNVPGQAWMGLKHNGLRVNSAVTDTFHTNEDLQGGNMAIIKLAAGDRVWIESFHANNAYLDGLNGFTTFSGLYLYA